MAIRKRIKSQKRRYKGSVKKWKNSLINTPCFILGNGPSLTDHNLNKLNNFFTIGINKAYKILDPTILMWQDQEFWLTDRYNIAKTECIKFSTQHGDPHGKYFNYFLQGGGFKLPKEVHTLHGFGATGPIAFQLAFILGCNPIILLGMDCQYRGEKTNFYGKNNFHKPSTLKNCNRGLRWIKSLEIDREVISCSDNLIFNNQNLDDIIKRFQSKEYVFSRDYFVKRLFNV